MIRAETERRKANKKKHRGFHLFEINLFPIPDIKALKALIGTIIELWKKINKDLEGLPKILVVFVFFLSVLLLLGRSFVLVIFYLFIAFFMLKLLFSTYLQDEEEQRIAWALVPKGSKNKSETASVFSQRPLIDQFASFLRKLWSAIVWKTHELAGRLDRFIKTTISLPMLNFNQ